MENELRIQTCFPVMYNQTNTITEFVNSARNSFTRRLASSLVLDNLFSNLVARFRTKRSKMFPIETIITAAYLRIVIWSTLVIGLEITKKVRERKRGKMRILTRQRNSFHPRPPLRHETKYHFYRTTRRKMTKRAE